MKKKVLFVGSFKTQAKDGSVGGQMYACKALINSELKEQIDWILLDTTGRSVPPPSVYVRLLHAVKRLFYFVYLLIVKKPDAVLVFSANGASIYEKGVMILVASLFGVKSVLAPRGGPIVDEIAASPSLKKFVVRVFKKANFVICQGGFWKTFFTGLSSELEASKFVVIPNWINVEQYAVDGLVTGRYNDTVNVLFMGWIQEDKGILDIFKALKSVRPQSKKIHFTFLGKGPAQGEIKKVAASGILPFTFSFPGWVYGEEKLRYLASSDIFMLPSHGEGLPNSLMEAMVCGVASIASNVGSVSDLIVNNETGILIDRGDVNALANALNTLIQDDGLRLKLSISGKQRIRQNHSLENACRKFEPLFK